MSQSSADISRDGLSEREEPDVASSIPTDQLEDAANDADTEEEEENDDGDNGAAFDKSDQSADEANEHSGDENSDGHDSDDESDLSSVGEDDDVQVPGNLRANLLGVLSGRFPSQPASSPAPGSSSGGFPDLAGFVERYIQIQAIMRNLAKDTTKSR